MNPMYRFDRQSGGAGGGRAAKDAPDAPPATQGEGKIGRRIERIEDGPLLRGKGTYVGDVDVPGGPACGLRAQPARARHDTRHRYGRGAAAGRCRSGPYRH